MQTELIRDDQIAPFLGGRYFFCLIQVGCAMLERFIVFEGIDGSGKTTQISLLADYLRERIDNVLVTSAMGDSELANLVKRIEKDSGNGVLPGTLILLYSALRIEQMGKEINPWLLRGGTVLCDRYIHSTYAYQGGDDWSDFLIHFNHHNSMWSGSPGATIILDVDIDTAYARCCEKGEGGEFKKRGKKFYNRARKYYLSLPKTQGDNYVVIDGARDKEEVFRDVIACLSQKFNLFN